MKTSLGIRAVLTLTIALAVPCHATVRTWTGAVSSLWSDADNWE